MLNNQKLILLDCTFRDGGYYNQWKFSKNLVEAYLFSIAKTGVKIVELGFRFNKKITGSNYGKFAYTSDSFLNKLNLPANIEYAIMINVKEYLKKNNEIDEEIVNKSFLPKTKSKVSIIRLATNINEIRAAIKISKILKNKGYKVIINLMQISTISFTKLKKLISYLNLNKKYLECFYIADSLGDLDIKHLKKMYIVLKKFKGPLGIHAHDNLNCALINTTEAINLKFKYVDSTIMGMGRGAGNTKTEEILFYLKQKKLNFDDKPLVEFIGKYFLKMLNKFQWGSNTYYFLSAKYQIHPTYVQKMLEDKKYKHVDIISTLEILKNFNTTKFKDDVLKNPFFYNDLNFFSGNWSGNNIFKNKKILVLGQGNNVSKYKEKIIHFIKKKKPIVISINTNQHIESKFIDYFCSCNYARFLMEYHKYESFNKPLIFPKKQIQERKKFKIKILNYGFKILKGSFLPGKYFSVIPNYLSLFYLLGILIHSSSRVIYLAGMDGYNKRDNNFKQINSIFKNQKYKLFFKNILSLTPTNYSITKSSSL